MARRKESSCRFYDFILKKYITMEYYIKEPKKK